MRTPALFITVLALSTHSAMAHGGHVGDLAGHSHWVGWAAAAAAGAIAAWSIKRRNKAKSGGKVESGETETGNQPDSAEA